VTRRKTPKPKPKKRRLDFDDDDLDWMVGQPNENETKDEGK
jgi:hypothetical protein